MPPVQRGHARAFAVRQVATALLRRGRRASHRRRVRDARAPRSRTTATSIEPRCAASPSRTPSSRSPRSSTLYLERTRPAYGRARSARCAQRLGYATRAYGDVPLRELERMVDELADWQARAARRDRATAIVGGAAADARRRCPLGLHEPRTRRSSPGRTRSRRRGRCAPTRSPSSTRSPPSSRAALPAAAGVRRRDRAAARGMGAARAARRRPPRRRRQRAPHRLRRRARRARQDERESPTGAALAAAHSPRSTSSRRGSTRRCSVPGARRRAAQPRQLPPARVGAGDRGVGRRQACTNLRPTLDVRVERARRRRDRVRARASDGHVASR